MGIVTDDIQDLKHVLIMDDVPDGVAVCDRKVRIQAASAAFHKLFGYGDGELVGKVVEVLIPNRYKRHTELRESYQQNRSNAQWGP